MATRHSTEETLPREGVSPAPAAEGPRVSVIVPARDAEATLGDTLASLRAQTLADLEAVVVDDASADGTRALAEAAAAGDARFRLLKCLEVRFEHVDHFRIMGIGPQCRRI